MELNLLDEDDEDELDIDAFFLPGGILDPDDDESESRHLLPRLYRNSDLPSSLVLSTTRNSAPPPVAGLFHHRPLLGSCNDHERVELEGSDQIEDLTVELNSPLGFILPPPPVPEGPELPVTEPVTLCSSPANAKPSNTEHNDTIREKENNSKELGLPEWSSNHRVQLTPKRIAVHDLSTKIIAIKNDEDYHSTAKSSVTRNRNVSVMHGAKFEVVPKQSEPTTNGLSNSMPALAMGRGTVLDSGNIVTDIDYDSTESSDHSCDWGQSIPTQKSGSRFNEAPFEESPLSSSKAAQKMNFVQKVNAATSVWVLDFFQSHCLLQDLHSLLGTCFVKPFLFLHEILLDQWYPRLFAKAFLFIQRFLIAARMLTVFALLTKSVISAGFCECFSSSPSVDWLGSAYFYYSPSKSAYIYFLFLFTPALCDVLMHYITLPHFIPHILSCLALFYCIDTGNQHQTSVSGRLSFHILSHLRWAIPLMLYREGFGDTNMSLMLWDSATRAILAFSAALLHHSLILSPLAWVSLALQHLFTCLIGSSITTSAILAVCNLATLHHLRSLSTRKR